MSNPAVVPLPEQASPRPAGLGGWLILPALGLVLTMIRQITEVVQLLDFMSGANWSALTNPTSRVYRPWWAASFYLELTAYTALFAFEIYVFYNFQKKRRRTPMLMIGWLMGVAGFTVYDQCLSYALATVAGEPDAATQFSQAMARLLVVIAIWVPYFLRSQRVKNTFVT